MSGGAKVRPAHVHRSGRARKNPGGCGCERERERVDVMSTRSRSQPPGQRRLPGVASPYPGRHSASLRSRAAACFRLISLAGSSLFLATLLAPPAFGQVLGNPPDEGNFTAFAPPADLPLSPVRTPEEQQGTFQLPPGFRIELIAAEPLVHDPVAIAFDARGDLWVAEMSGFNTELVSHLPALAGGTRQVPPGKVVRLQSSRGDGRYDRRTVFLDGLRSPRALAILRDGVLVADPPHLWHARDTDGDGRADEKTVVSDSYGRRGDDEGSANGLLWGRDNFIHNISHPSNLRRRDGRWEEVPIPVRGQFGISQDDWGRLFFTRNSQHLRADLFSPHYARRHPQVAELPWANIDIAREQTVWPGRPTPAVNRGYKLGEPGSRNGGLRADATLLEFTAACGTVIYRGANFPASFYHNAFVPEPVANLVKRTLLLESEGRLVAVNAYEGREFLTSTDERFRPVAAANAPDGSLVIVDMYRGIIEQYNFISSYLKEQTLRRRLHEPLHGQGRIWRVVYEHGWRETRTPALESMEPAALARQLEHPNGWWRDTAQQVLVERGDARAVPELEVLAIGAGREATRVAALWTLDGLDALTPVVAGKALADPSGKVRAAAVRLHERWLTTPQAGEFIPRLLPLATDPDPAVAVQLALSLGEARTPAGLDALQHTLAKSGAHPFVPASVASGLAGRELDFIDRLSGTPDSTPVPEQREMLSLLSSAVVREGSRDRLAQLFERLREPGRKPEWQRIALLEGFSLLNRASRGSLPLRSQAIAALEPLTAGNHPEFNRRSAQLLRHLQARETESLAAPPSTHELSVAEKQLAVYGRGAYPVCAGCHQPDGKGLPGVAPSLVNSRWVSGPPEALIRILLHGKEGTPGFAGGMPPAASFTDMQIAGMLTYIRNAWGLKEGAVPTELVTRVRRETVTRLTPWTDAELAALK